METNNSYNEIGYRSARATWWIFLISSVVILIAGGSLDYAIDEERISFFIPLFSVVSLLLITLGSVILTSAVGTFLLEKTGLLEVIKHQIADIMVNAGFINLLKKNELIKLKKNINEKLHTAEIAKNEDSLLNTVDRAIEPLLEKYYFKKYELEIQCEYREKYIEKRVSRTLLVNSSGYEDVPLNIGDFFSVAFIDSMDKDVQGAELIEFLINRKDYLGAVELKPIEELYSNTYRIKHTLYTDNEEVLKALILRREPIEIRITVITKTNIEDKMIVHKIPVACKEYTARFNYENKKYIVNGAPFGFMDAHIDGKYIMETISNSAVKISFNDWILPGDGVAFVINEKN